MEKIVPLLRTGETCLKCQVQCWGPQVLKGNGNTRRVLQRATKVTKVLEHLSYGEILKELELFIPGKKRLREDLNKVCRYLMG